MGGPWTKLIPSVAMPSHPPPCSLQGWETGCQDHRPSGSASCPGKKEGYLTPLPESCLTPRRAHSEEPALAPAVTPALQVPVLPPVAPSTARGSRAGWEPQVRKEPWVGEFGAWAATVLFFLLHKPAWASAAPLRAFRL